MNFPGQDHYLAEQAWRVNESGSLYCSLGESRIRDWPYRLSRNLQWRNRQPGLNGSGLGLCQLVGNQRVCITEGAWSKYECPLIGRKRLGRSDGRCRSNKLFFALMNGGESLLQLLVMGGFNDPLSIHPLLSFLPLRFEFLTLFLLRVEDGNHGHVPLTETNRYIAGLASSDPIANDQSAFGFTNRGGRGVPFPVRHLGPH